MNAGNQPFTLVLPKKFRDVKILPSRTTGQDEDQKVVLWSRGSVLEILEATDWANPLQMKGIVSVWRNTDASNQMVEAAGIEPASQANLPAATTCLVRIRFSAMRCCPDSSRTA